MQILDGSFRDPQANIYISDNRIFRVINEIGKKKLDFLTNSSIIKKSIENKYLIFKDGYEKMGLDLIYYKRMSPLEFLFDEKLIIPHPDGDISILTPDNIDTEKPLRLKGKGYQTSQGVGHMYLKFIVHKETSVNKEKLDRLKESYLEQ